MSEHIFVDQNGQTTFSRIRTMVEAGSPMPEKFTKTHNRELNRRAKWLWIASSIASVGLYIYLLITLLVWLRTLS
jgi:hypothetical protein